jgi:hypothetical protein
VESRAAFVRPVDNQLELAVEMQGVAVGVAALAGTLAPQAAPRHQAGVAQETVAVERLVNFVELQRVAWPVSPEPPLALLSLHPLPQK